MKFTINKLVRDEFGRPSGILAINKPKDMTSHDVVNIVRRELNTRKVGHAGALDPFATGVLVILVGKATKLSEKFIGSDKEYIAEILFGIKTDSADTEGEILELLDYPADLTNLDDVLEKFTPSYEQFVPVFSSIKIDGNKLRVLARKYEHHETYFEGEQKFVKFFHETDIKPPLVIPLPKHECKIPEIELVSAPQPAADGDLEFLVDKELPAEKEQMNSANFLKASVRVACSKGTYIRTLAEDIGMAFESPIPAMLINLQRTRVDRIKIETAIELDELPSLA